jgi:hypothetical protein
LVAGVDPPAAPPPLPPPGWIGVEDEQAIGAQQTTRTKGTDFQNPDVDLAWCMIGPSNYCRRLGDSITSDPMESPFVAAVGSRTALPAN